MKKILFSVLAMMAFAGSALAQVTVSRPEPDVKSQSYDYKITPTVVSAQWVNDGRNFRAAFNVGTGFNLATLYPDLPVFVKDCRVVPFVTADYAKSGLAPRTTLAFVTPVINATPDLKVQFGAVLNGLDVKNDFRAQAGVSPYFSVTLQVPRWIQKFFD